MRLWFEFLPGLETLETTRCYNTKVVKNIRVSFAILILTGLDLSALPSSAGLVVYLAIDFGRPVCHMQPGLNTKGFSPGFQRA